MKSHYLVLAVLLAAAMPSQRLAQAAEPRRLGLEDALRLAASRNRDVLSAGRTIEAVAADRDTAAQTPAPQLSLNSTQFDPSRPGGGGLWSKRADTVIRVDQTVERGDKRKLRMAAAASAYAAARADADEMLRQQRLAVSNAYWDLKLAQSQLANAQDNQRIAEQSSAAAGLRRKAGDLSRIEAERLTVEAQRGANGVATAQAQLGRARLALAILLADEKAASSLEAADAWPPFEVLPDVADAACLNRADVKAARTRVALALENFQLARAQAVSDITVGLQYEHFPPDAGNTLGVGISLPLFLAGRQDGAIRRAGVARAEAEAALERVTSQACSDLGQARREAEIARARLDRYDHALLPQARQVADSSQFARDHGALSLQDLLDARRTLFAVRLETEQAHADFAKALAALREAAGDIPAASREQP